MKLHELKASSSKRSRKRIGRGDGSGSGGTCGRGHKGQKSRSGSSIRPHFEGGQIPLFRRLPKLGFNRVESCKYNIVNTDTLEEVFGDKDTVDPEALRKKGVIRKSDRPVKVLGRGEIKKSLMVKADLFSATARKKIEDAGGKCELI